MGKGWKDLNQNKNKKITKKSIERMEIAIFLAIWQKLSKGKEKIEICRHLLVCSVMLKFCRESGQ